MKGEKHMLEDIRLYCNYFHALECVGTESLFLYSQAHAPGAAPTSVLFCTSNCPSTCRWTSRAVQTGNFRCTMGKFSSSTAQQSVRIYSCGLVKTPASGLRDESCDALKTTMCQICRASRQDYFCALTRDFRPANHTVASWDFTKLRNGHWF